MTESSWIQPSAWLECLLIKLVLFCYVLSGGTTLITLEKMHRKALIAKPFKKQKEHQGRPTEKKTKLIFYFNFFCFTILIICSSEQLN